MLSRNDASHRHPLSPCLCVELVKAVAGKTSAVTRAPGEKNALCTDDHIGYEFPQEECAPWVDSVLRCILPLITRPGVEKPQAAESEERILGANSSIVDTAYPSHFD